MIDLVGPGEHRAFRVNEFDRRMLVHDAFGIVGQSIRIRAVIVIVLHGLILHDHHAAVANVFEQAIVIGGQLRPSGIGTHAQQDDVIFLQIAAGDILPVQKLHVHPEIFERLRHRVAGAHHVSYPQSLGNFHVHAGGAIGGRNVQVIRTQSGITRGDKPFAVLAAA